MKPTRECDQNERMLRALLVLDALALANDWLADRNPSNDSGRRQATEEFVHKVYAIAHMAHGKCCPGSERQARFDYIDTMAAWLKTENLMDLEQVLDASS